MDERPSGRKEIQGQAMGIRRQMTVHQGEQEPRGSGIPPHPMLASRPIPASMLQVKLRKLQVDLFNHEPERP